MRLSFPPSYISGTLVKDLLIVYIHNFISEFSVLFHWSICVCEIFWHVQRVRIEIGLEFYLSNFIVQEKNSFYTCFSLITKFSPLDIYFFLSLAQIHHRIIAMKQSLGCVLGEIWLFLRPAQTYHWAGDRLCYCQQLHCELGLIWQIFFSYDSCLGIQPIGMRHKILAVFKEIAQRVNNILTIAKEGHLTLK